MACNLGTMHLCARGMSSVWTRRVIYLKIIVESQIRTPHEGSLNLSKDVAGRVEHRAPKCRARPLGEVKGAVQPSGRGHSLRKGHKM